MGEREDWRDNLSLLPEFDEASCSCETLPNGDIVLRRKPLKFAKFDVKPTDPVLFSDKNGSWLVVYGCEGGPYKMRV